MEEYYTAQYDEKVEHALRDTALFHDFIKEPSVQKQIDVFVDTLLQAGIDESKMNHALDLYLPNLIPPGTKGVVRGRKLESLVQEAIRSLSLSEDYEIRFEKDIKNWELTDETPDFYIKRGDKILIGMVQVDLWTGGAQSNRAFKYVFHPVTPTTKMVSVVCAKPPAMNSEKRRKLFQHGYEHKTLCYIRGLKDVVEDFFS